MKENFFLINDNPKCGDIKLCASCAAYSRTIPSCVIAASRKGLTRSDPCKILWGRVTCADLFDLKRELLQTGQFTFKAVSWCMFPVVKKGDTLDVEPVAAKDLEIGDIPVYRSGNKLFAHRIVNKKVIDGKEYLITMPDNAGDTNSENAEEGVPAEEILGRISRINSGARIFSTEKRQVTWQDRFMYSKDRVYNRFLEFIKRTVLMIQSSALYRFLSANVAGALENKINFQLVTPPNGRLVIYNYSPFEEIGSSDLEGCTSFHVLMRLRDKPIGYAVFLKRPRACPHYGLWLGEIYIRLRYRGMGFEKILVEKAEGLISKETGLKIKNKDSACHVFQARI